VAQESEAEATTGRHRAEPKCPACGKTGIGYLAALTLQEAPAFDAVYCDNCGHIYLVALMPTTSDRRALQRQHQRGDAPAA